MCIVADLDSHFGEGKFGNLDVQDGWKKTRVSPKVEPGGSSNQEKYTQRSNQRAGNNGELWEMETRGGVGEGELLNQTGGLQEEAPDCVVDHVRADSIEDPQADAFRLPLHGSNGKAGT